MDENLTNSVLYPHCHRCLQPSQSQNFTKVHEAGSSTFGMNRIQGPILEIFGALPIQNPYLRIQRMKTLEAVITFFTFYSPHRNVNRASTFIG